MKCSFENYLLFFSQFTRYDFSLFPVPFAVEERSGTITVIDEMRKFGRTLYDFEAVVADEKENTLATNVTIHIVESESGVPFSR